MPSPKILALWATPRSRSTAFSRMMDERGDFAAVHEPFQECAYLSPERLFTRMEIEPGALGYSEVLATLVAARRQRPVFIKDHAYYVEHLATPEFLSHFDHSFLIRHPREALPSYHAHWPDLTLAEAGYREQAALFDAVVQLSGKIPAVIDADDLIADPVSVVRAYCRHVGIPFVESALRWDPGAPNRSAWHEHLATTTGFQERPDRRYTSIDEDPHLRSLYTACLPAYEHLHRHRLGASNLAAPPPDVEEPGRSSSDAG